MVDGQLMVTHVNISEIVNVLLYAGFLHLQRPVIGMLIAVILTNRTIAEMGVARKTPFCVMNVDRGQVMTHQNGKTFSIGFIKCCAEEIIWPVSHLLDLPKPTALLVHSVQVTSYKTVQIPTALHQSIDGVHATQNRLAPAIITASRLLGISEHHIIRIKYQEFGGDRHQRSI